MLSVLGLAPAEEPVYRLLVTLPGQAPRAELAECTGLPLDELDRILGSLCDQGLVVRSEEGFAVAPPAIALGALVRQRRDALRDAETELVALAEAHRLALLDSAGNPQLVEVITGTDAVRQRFAQIHHAAHEVIRSIVIPGLTVVPFGESEAQNAGLRRGVDYRVIIGREFLIPERMPAVLDGLAMGEDIRVVDRAPIKMIVADHRLGMLPLWQDRYTAPASVLVHASGLLDTMIALFDELWARAHPLRLTPDGLAGDRPERPHETDRRILALLLAGFTDNAVATQLDLSLRTVQRRVSNLMEVAGVQTRMQLGHHAARHDWA